MESWVDFLLLLGPDTEEEDGIGEGIWKGPHEGESWAHHKIWQSSQTVQSEREDRSLQVSCSRTEDETGDFEMKDRKKNRDHLLVSQASIASRWKGPLGVSDD